MAIKFSDRVFGVNVDSDIIKEFKILSGGGLKQSKNPLEPAEPTFEKYLGDRTTFARMWTALLIERDNSQEVFYHVINDNRDKSYEPNDSINIQDGSNFFPELTNNSYLKPKAGITSISTKLEGSLGAIKNTTVTFVVHNKHDFEEIFLPFFLKPGSTVIVDYGWSDESNALYDIKTQVTNTDLELSQFKKYIYGEKDTDGKTIINGFINDNLGKVDTVVGRVHTYRASVNAQGSFECTLELKSANSSLLDTTITEENDLKYIFSNKVEDILVEMITGGKVSAATSAKYNVLDEKSKKEAMNKFFESLDVSNSGDFDEKNKLIPKKSLESGIFYQNVTDVKNLNNTDREILYMNYGLFEDLFLNELIAQNSQTDKHTLNFNTKETLVRYDENLILRQRSVLGGKEQLPVFLYPSSWQHTYNGKTPIEEYRSHKLIKVDNKQYENIYKTKIMPFRELFISVSLISKAFSSKQNVNDALESIIESINKDSYGVFKLKMISLNDSFSSISLQDVNLIPIPPEEPKEMLMFDVTSETSIVSNLNYTFETPKGGLASMIVIGEKSDYNFFDDPFKDSLNYLRILTENSKTGKGDVFYKSLPIDKEKSEKQKEKENKLRIYDFSSKKAKEIGMEVAGNFSSLDRSGPTRSVLQRYTSVVDAVRLKKTAIELQPPVGAFGLKPKKFLGLTVDPGLSYLFGASNKPQPSGGGADTKPKPVAVKANTVRDYYGKLAAIDPVLGNKETSVSPILPISIDLTVYGNTYLNIGDIFLINFLPKAYMDNVLFQIVGIDHKLDTNWQTTYTTVMKLKPTKKNKVVDTKLIKPVMDEVYTTAVTDEDGNAGMNVLAQRGSIIDKAEHPDGYVVHKISNILNAQVKEQKNNHTQDPHGDPRALPIPFGKPSSAADIAMLVAVQETISTFIDSKINKEMNTYYKLTKDDDKKKITWQELYRGARDDGRYKKQLGMVGFIEDKGWSDNAIIDYFEGNIFNDEIVEEMVKSLFGKSSLIKNNMYDKIKPLFPSGKNDKTEVYSKGIDALDDNYGIAVPTYIFKLGDYDEEQGELFSYTIKVQKHGLTTTFMPIIRIPEWFVNNDIYSFTVTLENNYNKAFKKLREFIDMQTESDKSSAASQKKVKEFQKYDF